MGQNGTEILKFSQNFLHFSQIFQRGHPIRGTDFSILVFLLPYLGLVEVKRYPDQRYTPRVPSPFAQILLPRRE